MAGTLNRKLGLGTALAMLALVMQICVPGGFMVSRGPGGPALVVCTGHGALTIATDDHGRPAKAPATHDSGVCAFAGHGVTTLGDAPPAVVGTEFVYDVRAASVRIAHAPGRGLAAPPPPSQGPPRLTI